MDTSNGRWIRTGLFAAVAAAGFLVPAQATAWIFDNRCADTKTESNLDAYVPPKALIMLDRSGSMSNSATSTMTRWQAAKSAIDELGKSMERSGSCTDTDPTGCDKVQMGLGLFWDGSYEYSCDGDGDGDYEESCTAYGPYANVFNPVQEDNHSPIMNTLGSQYPGGGTPTGEASRVMLNAPSLYDTGHKSVGVLVTDGEPDTGEAVAIANLCHLRNRSTSPADTYVVGFSSGSNTAYNSLLAAAGGTGTCCPAGSPNCARSNRIDPCTLTSDEQRNQASYALSGDDRAMECTGSLQADDPTQLKDSLMEVVQNLACTFDLNFPSETYDSDQAYSDPSATSVMMYHKQYGWVDIVHDSTALQDDKLEAAGADSTTASQYESEGWHFVDSDSRRRVQLSSKLCGDVLSGNIETVETQVACDCPNVGDACTVSGRTGSMCDDGRIACEVSDTSPGVEVCSPIHAANESLGVECTLSSNQGRCRAGIEHCVDGNQTCVQAGEPVPEICNGRDDDCNGEVDDIGDSWDNTTLKNSASVQDAPGAACGGHDACICANSSDADSMHRGIQKASVPDQFSTMVSRTETGCYCLE